MGLLVVMKYILSMFAKKNYRRFACLQTMSLTIHVRHRYKSQNVLAICDFDMRFIFVIAGWLARHMDHALANFPSFLVAPKGKYFFTKLPNNIIISCLY